MARLLVLALLLLVAVRAGGLERGFLLVLLIGALPLTLLPAYPLLVVAAARRDRLLAAGSAAVVVAHLLVVAPAVTAAPSPAGAEQAPRLRVVVSNLFVENPTPEAAGRALRALRPDVLVVPELSERGLAGLRASGLLEDLPHASYDLDRREETVGLFSRLPLTDVRSRRQGGRALPRGTVDVEGTAVRLLTAHPLPPIAGLEEVWRRSLAALAAEAREATLPVVLAGDLNADRDHASLRSLLDTGLRDAHDERGRGLARTWPADLPVLHLDHVLVRDGRGARVVVRSVREVDVPGSDHRGVVAELGVLPAQPIRSRPPGR